MLTQLAITTNLINQTQNHQMATNVYHEIAKSPQPYNIEQYDFKLYISNWLCVKQSFFIKILTTFPCNSNSTSVCIYYTTYV